MFVALNMELEIVRTVLNNEINDIYVCTDLKNGTGVFYTMISIKSANFRKLIAERMQTSGLFFGNKDYIGSFVFVNQLNLVFRYYHENLLSMMGSVYLYSFPECKEAAQGLIAAFAESGVYGEAGNLLLDDRNINVTKTGEIQLNYFLDFSKWEENADEFLANVAQKAFEILEINYKDRYESKELYPDDLRIYYLKLKVNGFSSFGQMITTIRSMSDKPVEMRGIIWWFRNRFKLTKNFLFRNSINTFLTVLVIATLIYAGYELGRRFKAERAYAKNVDYYGIEYIGDIYLGDEE